MHVHHPVPCAPLLIIDNDTFMCCRAFCGSWALPACYVHAAQGMVIGQAEARRRVPVASKDPVVAITCLCMRADALSTGEAAAAPAAPVVPAAAADLVPIGGEGEEDEEGGGGGLGDSGAAGGSPVVGADEGADPGRNLSRNPSRADSGGVEAVVFTWAAGGAPGALRRSAVGGADVRRFPDEAAMLAAWQAWLLRTDPDVLAIFQVRGLLADLIGTRERGE